VRAQHLPGAVGRDEAQAEFTRITELDECFTGVLSDRAAVLAQHEVKSQNLTPRPIGDETHVLSGPVEGGDNTTLYVRTGALLLRLSLTTTSGAPAISPEEIAQGIVDPDRMGALGWSAGGHWSNWILTHTNRFKAISTGAGTSNWISMYAQSDVQRNRQFYLGNKLPYDDYDAYWNQSPLKYIKNAKTPTMIHVVEGDPRNIKITTPEDLAAASAFASAVSVRASATLARKCAAS
jgi:hypothetical protein